MNEEYLCDIPDCPRSKPGNGFPTTQACNAHRGMGHRNALLKPKVSREIVRVIRIRRGRIVEQIRRLEADIAEWEKIYELAAEIIDAEKKAVDRAWDRVNGHGEL